MGKYVKHIKISKKPAKRQSDCYCCFFKTTGNKSFLSSAQKNLENGTTYIKDRKKLGKCLK